MKQSSGIALWGPGGRRGLAGLELLWTVLLGTTVVGLGAAWLAHQQRHLTRLLASTETASALARTQSVLGRELRSGVEGRDWSAPGGDSVVLRAFRGRALVCTVRGRDWTVGYRGDRALDPAKDSILTLDIDGRWVTAHVVRSRSRAGTCHGLPAAEWTLDRSVADATVARVFERGTYAVAGGALRYRRGRAGLQPLTYARLDTLSRIVPASGGGAQVDLYGDGSAGSAAPGQRRHRTLRDRGRR